MFEHQLVQMPMNGSVLLMTVEESIREPMAKPTTAGRMVACFIKKMKILKYRLSEY